MTAARNEGVMEEQTFRTSPMSTGKKVVALAGLAIFFGAGAYLLVTGGPPQAKATMDPHLLGGIFVALAVLGALGGIYSWNNPPSITVAGDHVRCVRFVSAFSSSEERFGPGEIGVSEIESRLVDGRRLTRRRVFHVDLRRGGVLLSRYPIWEIAWSDFERLHAVLRELQGRASA